MVILWVYISEALFSFFHVDIMHIYISSVIDILSIILNKLFSVPLNFIFLQKMFSS